MYSTADPKSFILVAAHTYTQHLSFVPARCKNARAATAERLEKKNNGIRGCPEEYEIYLQLCVFCCWGAE